MTPSQSGLVSVGRVAEETGIQPGTLRMWERRYGRPRPVRLPSGHRRYTQDEVRYVRRVVEAMAMGHRPGNLLRASEEELEQILERGRMATEQCEPPIDPWMDLARRLDRDELRRQIRDKIEEVGLVPALDGWLGPFLTRIGSEWADGELDVRHEHFTSQLVGEILHAWRSEREELRAGRGYGSGLVVASTLPGERHDLGMDMVSCVCESIGARCKVIGADTPLAEIATATRETGASVLAISVSSNYGTVRSDAAVAELREALPMSVQILVGGQGVRSRRRRRKGVKILHDLATLESWLRNRMGAGGEGS